MLMLAALCSAARSSLAQPVDDSTLVWLSPVRLDFDRPLYDHCLTLRDGNLYGVSLVYADSLRPSGLVAHRNLDSFHFVEEPVIRKSNTHTRCWVEPPGTLYVVWGENRLGEEEAPLDHIYTRHFDFERQVWSPREMIYENEPFRWHSNATSMVRGDQGRAVIAFSDEGRMLLLNRDDEGKWNVMKTELQTRYPALGRAPNGHVCDAFISFPHTYIKAITSSDESSVLFMCADDDGHLWKEPVLVSLSADDQPAHGLFMGVAPQGRIHLMWAKKLDRTGDFFSDDEYWHAYSDDGGRQWSEPSRIPIPEEVWLRSSERLVVLPNGTVHFFFDGIRQRPDPPHLRLTMYHMWWDGMHWTEPLPMVRGLWSLDPTPVLDASGRMLLLWTQQEEGASEGPLTGWATLGPGTFYTVLQVE
ncbi:MAG: sialidase family protein, partial [Rhodothermales bacterium]